MVARWWFTNLGQGAYPQVSVILWSLNMVQVAPSMNIIMLLLLLQFLRKVIMPRDLRYLSCQ